MDTNRYPLSDFTEDDFWRIVSRIPMNLDIPWYGRSAVGFEVKVGLSQVWVHVNCVETYELVRFGSDRSDGVSRYFAHLYGIPDPEFTNPEMPPVGDARLGYLRLGAYDDMQEQIATTAYQLAVNEGIEDITDLTKNWDIIIRQGGMDYEIRAREPISERSLVRKFDRWIIRVAANVMCDVKVWNSLTGEGAIYRIRTANNLQQIINAVQSANPDVVHALLNGLSNLKILDIPQKPPQVLPTIPPTSMAERINKIATLTHPDGTTVGRFPGAVQLLAMIGKPEVQIRRVYRTGMNQLCLCQRFPTLFPATLTPTRRICIYCGTEYRRAVT
jgi:hypothetical protein